MDFRIETIKEKKLVGVKLKMSFANFNVKELWRSFLLLEKGISNRTNDDLISMAVYCSDFFQEFDPTVVFDKWAVAEVDDFIDVPSEMKTFVLQEGLYAVFSYKGLSTSNSPFDFIFKQWLPNSNYLLDNRPHFELLGDNYRNNDENSEEEIYIPIKIKEHKNSI